MLLHRSYFLQFVIISGVTCRITGLPSKPLRKRLFLSRHVVTESDEFHGGVLVNEHGIIESVLKERAVELILLNKNFEVIDGGNWALMAGGIDLEVQVNEPGQTSGNAYARATQAAAAGGITTIVDMPLGATSPTTTVQSLQIKANIAKDEVFVDVGFWGGIVRDNGEQLQDMLRAGVVGFQCFLMSGGVTEIPYVTADHLDKVLTHLNGSGTLLTFHTEVIIDTKVGDCQGSKRKDPDLYETYLASYPDEMEFEAVSSIASHLNNTDVRIHFAQVSSAGVIPILENARENRYKNGYAGWRGGVTAETCNNYLTLSSDQIPPGWLEFKSVPPIRNNTNKHMLWEYIKEKRLDIVTSDHPPSVATNKGENLGGISSLQYDLSLFWTEAKPRGLKLSILSQYWSAGPARLIGLHGKKGSIKEGLEADLIFFDPNASFIVTPESIRYKRKISPYMNRVLTGKVMQTYVRGQIVYSDEELIGGPKGRLLLTDTCSHGVFIYMGFGKSISFSLLLNVVLSSARYIS